MLLCTGWTGLPPVPLLFQDGILHRVFIPGRAVWIVHEGDKFQEHALPAHAQFLAQVLTGEVVVLGVGVDAPCALLGEEVVEEGLGRLESVPLPLIGPVQHPAGAEGVPYGVLASVGLARLRIGVDLSDDLESLAPTELVIGVGINLTTQDFPKELKSKVQAISDRLPADLNTIAAELINNLLSILTDYEDGHYLQEYRQRLNLMGKQIDMQVGSKLTHGEVVDLSNDGGLVVKDKQNHLQTYYSGEVQKIYF